MMFLMALENKTIMVIGPTGSGKTNLAIDLALKTNSSIVNIDSRQFWKNCKKLSCSPTATEKKKAPHLLFNILTNNQTPSLGWLVKQIQKIPEKKILVGGSIFYARSLILGVPLVDIDKTIVKEVDNFQDPYAVLKNICPNTKIHPNDHYRIKRFLSFYLQTNKSFEECESKYKEDFEVITTSLNLDNITTRTEQNFQSYIEEIKTVGFVENFKSILGYQDCFDYLNNKINKKTCIEKINQSTIQYAKYQDDFIKKIARDLSELATFNLIQKTSDVEKLFSAIG